jgi:hypothetical protein
MKKNILIIFNFFLSLQFAQSQVQQEWIERYNGSGNLSDEASSIALDASGNVYVTGSSSGNGSGLDYTTIKYNSSGVQQWTVRYNGPGNSSDEALAIAVDGSGSVYVTGRSRAGSGENTTDYATVKYNSAGVQQWAARYNGISGGPDEARSIALDAIGNVYVTGQSGHSSVNADYATIKYNSLGVQQWVARYDGPAQDWDRALSIALDNLRNVYVTGTHSTDIGTAFHDYATIKYDSSGIQRWLTTYNGTANNWDEAVAIGVDAAGNVYVTGYSTGTVYDIATIKYNSTGVQQWVQRYSSSGNSVDVPSSMEVDAAGNLYITGAITFDFGTIKYNTAGVQQWLALYDASGNFDGAKSIAIDGGSNVYVTGPSSMHILESSRDYATVKYNNSGVQQWVQRHNGPANGRDEANSIAVDQLGNVYVTGYSSSNTADYATIKYSQTVGVQIISNEIPDGFNLLQNFPNPFNPVTKIRFSVPLDKGEERSTTPGVVRLVEGLSVRLAVYDILGRQVATLVNEQLSPGVYEIEWDASDYPSGVYFYKLITAGNTETKKMALIK